MRRASEAVATESSEAQQAQDNGCSGTEARGRAGGVNTAACNAHCCEPPSICPTMPVTCRSGASAESDSPGRGARACQYFAEQRSMQLFSPTFRSPSLNLQPASAGEPPAPGPTRLRSMHLSKQAAVSLGSRVRGAVTEASAPAAARALPEQLHAVLHLLPCVLESPALLLRACSSSGWRGGHDSLPEHWGGGRVGLRSLSGARTLLLQSSSECVSVWFLYLVHGPRYVLMLQLSPDFAPSEAPAAGASWAARRRPPPRSSESERRRRPRLPCQAAPSQPRPRALPRASAW